MIATRYTDALARIARPDWLGQARHAAQNPQGLRRKGPS